jgi:hypothetical protein
MKGRFGSCGLVLAALLGTAGHGQAACYSATQQLPAQVTSDFNGSPGQLLTQYANGGAQMISRIRDLAASNPATLQAIVGLIATANKDQKTAIGSGLAQAARICVPPNQAVDPANQQFGSVDIPAAITQANDADVKTAYLAILGDVALAAGATGGGGGTGGGAGSGGIGGSPGAGGGNGGSATFSSFSARTSPFTYSPSTSGGGSASVTTNTTTTITRSVSP